MAVTNGTSVTLMVGPQTPNQQTAVVPVLQKEDGSFVGAVLDGDPDNPETDMVAFGAGGDVRWIVPNDQPQIALAGGGVIGQSGIKYDGAGDATSQEASFNSGQAPGWFGNTLGTVYSTDGEMLWSASAPNTTYAATFAAFAGGNASGQGTAIQQVLSKQPQTGAEQLPDLSGSPTCYPVPIEMLGVFLPPTCGNINAIELLTGLSPDNIFQNYIQTYAPVTIPAGGGTTSPNPVMTFTGPGGSNAVNVTGAGQILTIALAGWAGGAVQKPFQIMTERFDPVNHVISVVTLAGHPLAGWRYWRVYSIGTNDVVVETGAYDQPGPGPANYAGYYLSKWVVEYGWRKYMQYFQRPLGLIQGTQLQNANALGGIAFRSFPPFNGPLLSGYWDYYGDFTNYILNNVCQSTACH